jgi:GNAT superfamily N-acetyltransferase
MDAGYTIVLARPQDVGALAGVEAAAATMLKGYAPASILEETTAEEEVRQAQQEGRLWVALMDDTPVGFAQVEILAADLPHLEELDVHPRHGRRGLGTALVKQVLAWAAAAGYTQLTLTTFRAVPWNMPFYARLGFQEIPASQLRPELEAVVRDETRRGLDPADRVVMVYRLGRGRA